jgi:RHS repeat-associated protein
MLSLSYLGNSATFGYDSRNRKTSETWTIGGSPYTLFNSYDQADNLVAITYPDNTKVNFSIDPMNRATTVKSGSSTLAAIAYRSDSKVANITYGNGVLSTYRYDNRGRPTEVKVVQGQTTLLDLTYGYDNVGNVVSIGTESYSYDYLNRLTVGIGPWGTTKYGYDGLGNRLWLYQSPANTTYAYGSYNRLSSAGSTSFTYDNNGNRLTQVSGGTTTKYNYDFENRLTSVSQGGSTLGNYSYSPLGMRIQKIESGTTTAYLNSDVNVLYEKAGTTVNDYALAGNLLVAKLSGSNTYYFHQDALGSTRLVTTGSTTSFSTNYQPFGPQYGATGTDPNYKYTGKPQDTPTGLYYYGARYYDTVTGRFISRDPAKAPFSSTQSNCAYSYVRNNPETLTDPSGACVSKYWLASQLIVIPASLMGLYWLQWSMPFVWAGLVGYALVFVVPAAAWYIGNNDYWGLFWNVVIKASWQVIWTIGRYMGFWGWLGFAAKIASNTWWIPLVITFGFFFASLMYYWVTPPYQYQMCPW